MLVYDFKRWKLTILFRWLLNSQTCVILLLLFPKYLGLQDPLCLPSGNFRSVLASDFKPRLHILIELVKLFGSETFLYSGECKL